ncbi:MAG TPA: MerR family transcriptional regulator [Rhodothermales bacterium]|nr:MerR family transcriptional regulator [Rhodothermales bacterium]
MQTDGIKKLYYSIGEVSEETGLDAHVLRYWQTEFEQLEPRKNRAGRRVYTEEDIAIVRRIQHLLRVEKYTIEGARQALELEEKEGIAERQNELVELRSFLEKLLEKL